MKKYSKLKISLDIICLVFAAIPTVLEYDHWYLVITLLWVATLILDILSAKINKQNN